MSFQALKQARDARNQSDPLLNSKKQPQPTEPERIEERIESQVETSPPKDEIAKEDALAQVPDQSGSSNPVQSESQQILISENPNLIVKTSKQRGRSVFWDAKENCKKGEWTSRSQGSKHGTEERKWTDRRISTGSCCPSPLFFG